MERIDTNDIAERLIADNEMAILYFGHDGCGVCKVMLPKLETLLLDYPKIKAGYVKADTSLELAATHSVFTVPAILVFTEGKEVIREARHISLLELNERINRYYDLLFE